MRAPPPPPLQSGATPPPVAERLAAAAGEPVDAPAPPGHGRPGALEQPVCLEAVQHRVDGALGKRELAAAPALQLLDHRVAVRRPVAQRREDEGVQMALERLGSHTASVYLATLGVNHSSTCRRRARPSRRGRARGRCGAASRGRASRPRQRLRRLGRGLAAPAPRTAARLARRELRPQLVGRVGPGGQLRLRAPVAPAPERRCAERASRPPRGLASRARWYTGSTSRHARRAVHPKRRQGGGADSVHGKKGDRRAVNEYEILLMLDPELAEERSEEIIARIRTSVEGDGGTLGRPRAVGPPQARLRDRPQAGRRLPPAALHRDARRRSPRSRACSRSPTASCATSPCGASRAGTRRLLRRLRPPCPLPPMTPTGPRSSLVRSHREGAKTMANINRVVLVGNLTRDPELRHTGGGTAVCCLRIAVNTRRKDGATGEWTEKPNYFDITVWGNQGENCAQYLAKGRPGRDRRPARVARVGGAGRHQAAGGRGRRRHRAVPRRPRRRPRRRGGQRRRQPVRAGGRHLRLGRRLRAARRRTTTFRSD